MADAVSRRNRSLALNIVALAVGMFGLAYAAVPLYDLFCRITGFGGTTQVAPSPSAPPLSQTIEVRFNSDTSPKLPWKFTPDQPKVTVRIGEEKLISYYATNLSPDVTRGTATYNVTPHEAGVYFQKVECFCFVEQTLEPNQSTHFPVSFFVDPEIVNDPKLKDLKTITLSYTFFPLKEAGTTQ